jgi:uncharacterized membrane protein YfcA
MEVVGYGAALLMGVTLGMIGGGGSILTVPILVYLFKIDAVLATAYSLFIVGTTALAGGIGYLRRKEVDLKTGFIFAVPSFIGVYLTRRFGVPALPDTIFTASGTWGDFEITKPMFIMGVFAILMIAAALSMILAKPPGEPKALSPMTRGLVISAEGLVVGAVTGLVGAGGGFLIIPALVLLVGLPMKQAVGTSLFIIAAKSLLGFLGDLRGDQAIDWQLLLTLAGIAIVGLVVGMSLVARVPEKALKKAFGIFVLIMGSWILIDQLSRLS